MSDVLGLIVEAGDAPVFDVSDEQAASAAIMGGTANSDDGGRLTRDGCRFFGHRSIVFVRIKKRLISSTL